MASWNLLQVKAVRDDISLMAVESSPSPARALLTEKSGLVGDRSSGPRGPLDWPNNA
ncbi:MAG: hypothetical protein WA766_17525 [Candidatus Acidiferrales bacterium]